MLRNRVARIPPLTEVALQVVRDGHEQDDPRASSASFRLARTATASRAATSRSLSCPHAAAMSWPFRLRTVVFTPPRRSIAANASTSSSDGRLNGTSGTSLNGIRFVVAWTPRSRRTSSRGVGGRMR